MNDVRLFYSIFELFCLLLFSDIETIDALAEAIAEFEGGMVLVSHDFRLISQVAEEIWICENNKIVKWEGDILEYKEHLKTRVTKQNKANMKNIK